MKAKILLSLSIVTLVLALLAGPAQAQIRVNYVAMSGRVYCNAGWEPARGVEVYISSGAYGYTNIYGTYYLLAPANQWVRVQVGGRDMGSRYIPNHPVGFNFRTVCR